jgi:hypothetical protein
LIVHGTDRLSRVNLKMARRFKQFVIRGISSNIVSGGFAGHPGWQPRLRLLGRFAS